ncbi:unnamed protein product [Parascedosporium putredinis]|uniref:NADP-dependent oxidoreductase domain-containing protein n=1 Tax=Parascedosporium putredinis TaxID=1442378 RepID=A0A9P1GWQ9_9PEZI|nr:unnamed protein product [Parascedosporium putredinis]CAI7989017.1 unnamed protein product [Parascedosporium putredinis]
MPSTSIRRALPRAPRHPYLDLVYCHDVEFVSPHDALAAIGELRRLRDEGKIRYVGVSGYPLPVLTSIAKLVLERTGEPLDAVQSYSNFNLQNTTLGHDVTVNAFRDAKVGVLINASILSMGLLTTHLQHITKDAGLELEDAAIRWAMDSWADKGAEFGSTQLSLSEETRMGITAIGVTSVDQLDATWKVWEQVKQERRSHQSDGAVTAATETVRKLAEERIWPALGAWKDYTWASPDEHYVPSGPSRPAQ